MKSAVTTKTAWLNEKYAKEEMVVASARYILLSHSLSLTITDDTEDDSDYEDDLPGLVPARHVDEIDAAEVRPPLIIST